VPLVFSPLHSRLPTQEVRLEEVVGGRLEEESQALAEAVAEHVLLCFRSQDSQVSLEPVAQGPYTETEEEAQASV
jgi:hypothetical protein